VPPSPALQDGDTAAGFLRGDADAVASMDRWISGAAAPFRRRLAGDWQDLLQEARIEILRLLRNGSWRGEARLRTYVWQVVAHTCLDAMRRQKRRPALEPVEPDAPLPSADPSPLDRVLEADSRRRLLAALELVPADCRDLWRLILSGLSYQQISAQTGVAEGALRVRAHRCRKRAVEALAGNAPPVRAAEGR
jgi:RNA polymerase sigma-70 factor (ECF subfamily)